MTQKIEQKSFLLEIAEQQKDIIYEDSKILARLDWLHSWDKNPRVTTDKSLKKLENQIEELGVYKPLVITLEGDYGVILGGNQRFKVLKKLREKYKGKSNKHEYVWVSIVNPESETDRIKYAISDNFSAGEYSREQLKELMAPIITQGSLFSSYDIEFINKTEVEKFIDEMSKSDDEIKLEKLENALKEAGIDETVIMDVKEMSSYKEEHKFDHDFNDQSPVGTGCFQYRDKKIFVLKLVFTEENEETYNKLIEVYKNGKGFVKANHPNIYQKMVDVYGQGKGDTLVKTMHLVNSLGELEINSSQAN